MHRNFGLTRINHLQRVNLAGLNLSREIGSEVGDFFLVA